MKIETKSIISGLFAGLIFAGLMAGFDYSDGQYFKIWRFILRFWSFGIFMGLMNYYFLKKQVKSEN
jgi:hypothetical protein